MESPASSPYAKRYPLISGGARITTERRVSEWEKTDKILDEAEERKAVAKEQMFSKRGERKAMVRRIFTV